MRLLLVALLLLCCGISASAQTAYTTETPRMANDLADSVGFDFHSDYTTSPYVTQWAKVSQLLIRSGVKHIRDSANNPLAQQHMEILFGQGIKHSLGFPMGSTAQNITSTVSNELQSLDYVEPANEYDSTKATNTNWATQLAAQQNLLYSTVRANASFNQLLVLGPPLVDLNDYAELGNLEQYEDAGSLHDSTCDYNPGTYHYDGIPKFLVRPRLSTPTKPIWLTETSYSDNALRDCWLPDSVIAKYAPRSITEYFNLQQTFARLYFYQMVDMPSDPIFGATGFVDAMGNAKPQFTAVSSLVNITTDPGAVFTPKPLTYLLSGATTNVQHTLLQRRSGTYELLLWVEMPAWNHDNHTAIAVPSQDIQLSLPAAPRAASLYTYNSNYKFVKTSIPPVASFNITVTDQITIVEWSPAVP